MLETIVEILKEVPWYWVLIIGFLMTLIENLFPPAPGDSVVVFTGAMASFGNVNIYLLVVTATFGSVIGFLIMFLLGKKLENKLIHSNKFKFISKNAILKIEKWFTKYGYWLIVINRFIAGTRAAIAFFAGMSHLSLRLTLILSALSAFLWNGILIYLGFKFGDNWQIINQYIKLYGTILFPIIIAIILLFTIRYFIKNKKEKHT